jgi:hypothetical protein
MLLDWLYNISNFVIDFLPPPFIGGVESKDGPVFRLRVINLNGVNDGVSGISAPYIRL